MPTPYSDFLQRVLGPNLVPWSGVYVGLKSNNTGTAYKSSSATTTNGQFSIATIPADIYTVYTSVTGSGLPTGGDWIAAGDTAYAVPYVAGDDAALKSVTTLSSSPYVASSIAGTLANVFYLPPPNGTDDTAGILAAETAMAAGGKIIFQPGTYIATKLTKRSLIYWEGAGVDATTLKLKNGTNDDLIQGTSFGTLTGGNTVGGIHHWGLKDMTLNGNKANQSGTSYGLRVYGYGYKLEHVKVDDALTDGIYSEWANTVGLPATNEEDVWAFLKNVQVYRSGGNGIHWLGPHDSGWKFVWAGKNGNHGIWLDATGVASGSGTKAENCHSFANTQNQWRLNTQASLLECKGESTSVLTPGAVAMLYIGTGSNESDVIGGAYGTFGSSSHNQIGIELNAAGGMTDLHIDTNVQNVTVAAMKIGAAADAGGNFFRLTAYLPDAGAVVFGTTQPNIATLVLATATSSNGTNLYQIPQKFQVTTGGAVITGGLNLDAASGGPAANTINGNATGWGLQANGNTLQTLKILNAGGAQIGFTPFSPGAVTVESQSLAVAANTVTLAGAVATQRFYQFANSTIAGAFTVTDAATVSIGGPPIPSGSTLTRAVALRLESGDMALDTGGRILSKQTTAPTVGSGGTGTSALSIVAGSTNIAGQFQVTLTAVAPGVVCGVIAFNGGPLATAPKIVVCSLAAPTAGVAAPPTIGADTYTTSGFTVRSYGPTTVTTGTYIINFWCIF